MNISVSAFVCSFFGRTAAPCKAIRQAGSRLVKIGTAEVWLGELAFHVLRSEVPHPAAGGVLAIGGTSYTVEVVDPVDRDADDLMWSLRVLWGIAVVYRSIVGSGSTQYPPLGGPWTVAASALAGATTINIRSQMTVGQLRPGDKLTIGGTVHTVGNTVQAVTNVLTGIQITPALAGPVAAGDAVTLTTTRDYAVRAAFGSYEASELLGGVLVGDQRLVIMAADLGAAGMTDTPKATDRVTVGGRAYTVQSAAALYAGAAVRAWDVQGR